MIRRMLVHFAIWLIQKAERHKDRHLSWELHRIADRYDPRPTGEWEVKP